ncbi:MAG: UDP-3-O-(3-hydroxymyristoyl)glucosamine N-acyltransferase [Gemmatimonadota bacterium]|nr:UDP-3-O-(3-hydroxymyristoyl)glucosamine N-acyltransferase [Gemmatimonadota bacterium]
MTFSVQELAERVSGRVEGDPNRAVHGVAPVASAGPEQLTYIVGSKYLRYLADCEAAAVLVPTDLAVPANGKTLIRVESPELAFSTLLKVFHPPRIPPEGVHPSVVLGPGVELGTGVSIGPHVVIDGEAIIGAGSIIGAHTYVGYGVRIGDGTRIDPGCSVLEGAVLGKRVRLHCGARISSDGFGYTRGPDGPVKIEQIGLCILGDDVEVGANSTIDRGSLGDTVVGNGTKIDNLVHIGHNCSIGRNCYIVAQVGIAGSTVIGDGVRLGGQVGVAGHITIGDGAAIAAGSGTMTNIPAGEIWSGRPARRHRDWLRASSAFYKLPDLLRRVSALERAAEDIDDEEA